MTLQWEEDRPGAYHVRRRLTAEETAVAGDVVDLRGKAEAVDRYLRALPYLPPIAVSMAQEEIGL